MICKTVQSGGCLHLGETVCFNFILLIKDLTIVPPEMLVISYQNEGRNNQEGRNIPF